MRTAVRALFLGAALGATACDSQRDRPLGPEEPPVPTSVLVRAPRANQAVGADSMIDVVIDATGSIRAVEFFAKRVSLPDTVGRERRVLEQPESQVEVRFRLHVPPLATGINLAIQGVAEDLAGELHLSEPTFVVVIDCEEFPLNCESGL